MHLVKPDLQNWSAQACAFRLSFFLSLSFLVVTIVVVVVVVVIFLFGKNTRCSKIYAPYLFLAFVRDVVASVPLLRLAIMAGDDISKPNTPHGLTLGWSTSHLALVVLADIFVEAWAEGFCVGALIIMAGITVANMRRGVLLHKLILIEVRDEQPTHSS